MANKQYSSYAEIDRDLEILQIEREINYQKTLLSVDKTKESIVPLKGISNLIHQYESSNPGMLFNLIKLAIPLISKWFINRKRGD
ncbi:DUF6327 family protein [Flavobacterium sp. SUN046]|uniref:DUF6327 family protein n=1 Tax=Flavobacterium sp. SUN046 TaxID=3002440 RepID=UPI002DB9B93F|nr:DUF6327 family protein [Flavobacterium sp. SUN046]MEC4048168.1 DUF6327 family protein [Flavobacterium sp. SUN046]